MLLSIESSDRLCGACVFDMGKVVASKTIDIGKGHAELLMGVIDDVLNEASIGHQDLTSIAVCVGPGSFTGIRVGVSAAIGLSLALNIPLIGVTSLQALAIGHEGGAREILCIIDAHRGSAYVQSFSANGLPLSAPEQMSFDDIARLSALQTSLLCGSGVAVLSQYHPELDQRRVHTATFPNVNCIAVAAANPLLCVPAKPLYLRRPDAKPQESYTHARALRQ